MHYEKFKKILHWFEWTSGNEHQSQICITKNHLLWFALDCGSNSCDNFLLLWSEESYDKTLIWLFWNSTLLESVSISASISASREKCCLGQELKFWDFLHENSDRTIVSLSKLRSSELGLSKMSFSVQWLLLPISVHFDSIDRDLNCLMTSTVIRLDENDCPTTFFNLKIG